jgi:hypothetical protein
MLTLNDLKKINYRSVKMLSLRYNQLYHDLQWAIGLNADNVGADRWISAISAVLAVIMDNECGGIPQVEGNPKTDADRRDTVLRNSYEVKLGNLSVDDAARWIGRGPYQLTGRSGYQDLEHFINKHSVFVTSSIAQSLKYSNPDARLLLIRLASANSSPRYIKCSLTDALGIGTVSAILGLTFLSESADRSDPKMAPLSIMTMSPAQLDLVMNDEAFLGVQAAFMVTTFFRRPPFVMNRFDPALDDANIIALATHKYISVAQTTALTIDGLCQLIISSLYREGYRRAGMKSVTSYRLNKWPSLEVQAFRALYVFMVAHPQPSLVAAYPDWIGYLNEYLTDSWSKLQL